MNKRDALFAIPILLLAFVMISGMVYASNPIQPMNPENPPIITLNGNSTVYVTIGSNYIDAGATAKQSDGKDITNGIAATPSVITTTLGTYTVYYTVSDNSGNIGTASRTVKVVPADYVPSSANNINTPNTNISDNSPNASDNYSNTQASPTQATPFDATPLTGASVGDLASTGNIIIIVALVLALILLIVIVRARKRRKNNMNNSSAPMSEEKKI
jgi:Domain of unknown function (DUF5011)